MPLWLKFEVPRGESSPITLKESTIPLRNTSWVSFISSPTCMPKASAKPLSIMATSSSFSLDVKSLPCLKS